MFGIYKYENGLQFTGKIARTEQEAKDYLSRAYGRIQSVFTGEREKDGTPIYEARFVPGYNEETFVIQPVKLI
jgi:hypothetical protein